MAGITTAASRISTTRDEFVMTNTQNAQLPRGAALYLALSQFLFITTWIPRLWRSVAPD